ncbi:LysR family transcriptional regulator [Puniceibacterium sp. IMCC21224]|uniref:LysR family transcriptional regulator n=1 Tax=Puniceibacterium sp. IMCC21224 TaxID=1618204 RepID=UPI00064DB287|nr:LysR family transcriptional regulator [Puniceibacterium sp. IMCC21224]KMK65917.1 transcriptional regulator [Puniceibacterium sp. IMCC21224]
MQDRQIMGLIATFVAVAEMGSFKRAAEAIGRSPSAVTAQISQLEDILQARLIVRTTRRIRLTDAGEQFLIRGRRLLNETERLIRDFRGHAAEFAGKVVLAVSPTIAVSLMPKVLDTLGLEHPEVKIALREGLRDDVLAAVESGKVDFGIGPYWDVPQALSFEHMFDQLFRLILPEKHPVARRGYAEPSDLKTLDLLCPGPGATARIVIEELAAEAGFTVEPRYETLQYPTLYALVAGGLGATVMPVVDPNFLAASRLVAVPFHGRKVSRKIGVIQRRGEPLSPASRLFIRTVRDTVLRYRDHFQLQM